MYRKNVSALPRYGLILKYMDQVLVVLQAKSGLWGFLKGCPELNETVYATAKREAMEESNIDVDINKIQSSQLINICHKSSRHYYFVVHLTRPEIATPLDNKEIVECKWMSISDLNMMRTSIFTKLAIKQLQK